MPLKRLLRAGAGPVNTLIPEDRHGRGVMRLPLGARALDDLLDGGVESGAITEFYGEAGAGKTNWCLQLARNVARDGRKVVYVDTEGVSLERLQQICGPDFKRVQQNVLFFEPYSLVDQEQMIEKAARLAATADVGLIVLDSATLHYRLGLGTGDDVNGRRALAAQLQVLLTVARRRDVPVVMTSQVFTNVDKGDELEPVGGQLVRHILKAIVRLEKTGPGRRRATIVKHRSIGEGLSADFVITVRGLESAGGDAPATVEVAPHASEPAGE